MKLLHVISLCILLSFSAKAQEGVTVDMAKLGRNIVLTQNEGGAQYMIMWTPVEYWITALRANKGFDERTIQKVAEQLTPYTIVCASRFRSSISGAKIVGDDSALIAKGLKVFDPKGNVLQPIKRSQLPPTIVDMMTALKPVFAQMLGDVGESMQMSIYNNLNSDGSRMIDPTKPGAFKVVLYDKTFVYNLPLPALLPPQYCPVDNGVMEGDWKYCPYHGSKLN